MKDLLRQLKSQLDVLGVGEGLLDGGDGGVVGYLVHSLQNLLDKGHELVGGEKDVTAGRGCLYGSHELEGDNLSEVDGELCAFFGPCSGEGNLARFEGEGTVVVEAQDRGAGLDAGLGEKLVALLFNGAGTGRSGDACENVIGACANCNALIFPVALDVEGGRHGRGACHHVANLLGCNFKEGIKPSLCVLFSVSSTY